MTTPFTLDHFRDWAAELVLDNGDNWVPEPFQEAFAQDVFAGVRECWLVVPEGNGKTTLVAGLALYHCEFTDAAWVPVGAASRDQARILYRQAAGFVRRTPRLKEAFRCFDGYRKIVHREKESQIEVFAADADTADGVIPTLCLVDELHRHKDLGLYLTWSGKLDKRNGQIITISTAGEPGAEFELTRERLRQQATTQTRGTAHGRYVAPGTVLHEYAVPEGGDHADMELVKAANPFSGITVETLAAKRARPTMTTQHWLRFVCNIPARGSDAAIEEQEWFGAKTDEPFPEKGGVWVGYDPGWKWDTTALVPLLWRGPEDRFIGPPTILVPPRDGSMLHPDEVKRAFIEMHARYRIHTVVMDMQDAEDIAAWIKSELGVTVIDRAQGNVNAVDDYAKFMEALRNGWLKHTGDPELTRHALNAITRLLPFGDPRFDRPTTTRQGGNQDVRVIDALVAAAMANSAASSAPDRPALFVGVG